MNRKEKIRLGIVVSILFIICIIDIELCKYIVGA